MVRDGCTAKPLQSERMHHKYESADCLEDTVRCKYRSRPSYVPVSCAPDLLSIQILCPCVDALVHFKDTSRVCVVSSYPQTQSKGGEDVYKWGVGIEKILICLAIQSFQDLKLLHIQTDTYCTCRFGSGSRLQA